MNNETTPDAGTCTCEPPCSAELWRVRQDPVCQPIWNYADSLPLSELARALEIMRLCALLYVELHKPNYANMQDPGSA